MTYDEAKAIFAAHKGCSTWPSAKPQFIYFDRLGTSSVIREEKPIHFPDSERWAKYSFADFAPHVRKTGRADSENVYYELIPEDAATGCQEVGGPVGGAAILTCGAIREAVGKYNRGESFRQDLALRAALGTIQSLPPSLGRFLAETCLVADWGSIQFFSFGDRLAMAGEIEISWPALQPMRSWTVENWDAQTTMLTRAVELLSYSHLLPTSGAKRQLSFLSKYLHACVNDGFAIWDQYSQRALPYNYKEPDWEAYRGWLTYVRQEAAKHEACCLEQVQLPGENLVRTFDQALYIIGEEIKAKEDKEREQKRAVQPVGNSAK